MHSALSKWRIYMYLQPKYYLDENASYSVALVRWYSADGDPLSR